MNRPESADQITARATAQDGGRVHLTHKQIRAIYFGLVLSMFLSALNQTIVATALPTIGRSSASLKISRGSSPRISSPVPRCRRFTASSPTSMAAAR